MNRDELITKLAMELAEWPADREDGEAVFPLQRPDRWGSHPAAAIAWSSSGTCIKLGDYLAERERLIAKPSWDDAPEWATHLCQNGEGEWKWYPQKPEPGSGLWCHDCSLVGGRVCKLAKQGAIPAGHDWRETLEQRPIEVTAEEDEAFEALADKLLREDMEKSGRAACSCGSKVGEFHAPECAEVNAFQAGRIRVLADRGKLRAPAIVSAALGHMQDRVATYDAPSGERSMGKTVAAFNALTGRDLTESEGWLMMAVLKMARSTQGGFRADNYEDLAAYAGLYGEASAQEANHG